MNMFSSQMFSVQTR